MSDQPKVTNTKDEPKVGVYVCHCGGNISDHVSVDQVLDYASHLPGVVVARQNSFMCSDPGQEMIMEDIKSGTINRVVVASCAPSLHETTFRGAIARAGLNPYLYEHANIREQVSWVHHGPGATSKASSLVAAAVAKACQLRPLTPLRVNAWGHATVIGGGVAGLKAAHDLAERGVKVTLVEKTPFLGGNVSNLAKVFPTEDSPTDLINALASPVLDHPDIEVLTCAEVEAGQGYVGNFKLKVVRRPPTANNDLEALSTWKNAGGDPGAFVPYIGLLPSLPPESEEVRELETGALVVATGFKHYEPAVGEYGYGQHPEVITLSDFARLVDQSAGGEFLVYNGRPVRSAALIHCVGSRRIPGVNEAPEGRNQNEYCSRVCCTASLEAAVEFKKKFPDTALYELYRDIRTYGRGHEEYYLEAGRNQVMFVRFGPEAPPVVGPADDNESALKITVPDTLLGGEELEIPVDLVVLAVGMEPAKVSSLVEMFKLPVGADRFLLEVHPKLRPVEVAVTGVLLAGTAQAPMDITESTSAAAAAAVKASAILVKGYVELDPFIAEINQDLCTGCGDCLPACIREGALELGEGPEHKLAVVNPALCQGCGVCVSACSENAIELAGWTLSQYEAMVDAIVNDQTQSALGG